MPTHVPKTKLTVIERTLCANPSRIPYAQLDPAVQDALLRYRGRHIQVWGCGSWVPRGKDSLRRPFTPTLAYRIDPNAPVVAAPRTIAKPTTQVMPTAAAPRTVTWTVSEDKHHVSKWDSKTKTITKSYFHKSKTRAGYCPLCAFAVEKTICDCVTCEGGYFLTRLDTWSKAVNNPSGLANGHAFAAARHAATERQ